MITVLKGTPFDLLFEHANFTHLDRTENMCATLLKRAEILFHSLLLIPV